VLHPVHTTVSNLALFNPPPNRHDYRSLQSFRSSLQMQSVLKKIHKLNRTLFCASKKTENDSTGLV